jgi:ATP-dependent Clp protease ATP-binding subunit ClpA
MFERFAQSARVAVEDARYEVGRRGDRRIGTEHLLIALLREETIACAIGADPEAAREAADELDRAALTAVGIDIENTPINGHTTLGKHVPFTPAAKIVLRQTLVHATTEKAKSITSRHMALALLDRVDPDPAAAVLAALSVDRAAARDRLNDSA